MPKSSDIDRTLILPKPPVVLFKTPAEPISSDPYYTVLDPSYSTHFVPVLSEIYHLDQLSGILQAEEEWEGVIVTSRRGAEGWVQAAHKAVSGIRHTGESPSWSNIPLWSVGTASVDTLQSAVEDGTMDKRYLPSVSSNRIAKSAKDLIPLLLDSPPQSNNSESEPSEASHGNADTFEYRPYLIIRGDKSLEEIPFALRENGRKVIEVTVYSTSPRPVIAHNIISTIEIIDDTAPLWLAFFSPSSASFALEHTPREILSAERTRIFAIGETTKSHLEQNGLTVHAVAETPTAQGMLDGILRYDDGQ